MPEETRASQKNSSAASFLPDLIDRMFSTVETWAERLMAIVSESSDGVVARAIQKLFGLLLIGVAITFILSGIAEVLNHAFQLVGVGEIVVGVLLLWITAVVMIVIRKK